MANVKYLICSFCQGPSSHSLHQKLHSQCRIHPSDLDWLDKWRLLLPSHVEWDLNRLQDLDFQSLYEKELPKTNVVSKITWVPSIEGRISDSPESDDLDGWRTINFVSHVRNGDKVMAVEGQFEHLFSEEPALSEDSKELTLISKRTLHPYHDDIGATRLPFHSACLRILYEACNEITYSTYASATVSDVVALILLPSWKEGDVNMDWLSRKNGEEGKTRLATPWGEHWQPLDPTTNVHLCFCYFLLMDSF